MHDVALKNMPPNMQSFKLDEAGRYALFMIGEFLA